MYKGSRVHSKEREVTLLEKGGDLGNIHSLSFRASTNFGS
jgi:hypothetical protein